MICCTCKLVICILRLLKCLSFSGANGIQIIQTNVTGDLTKLSFQVKDSMHQMLNETVLLVDVLKYHIGDVRAQLNGLSDAIQRASSIFSKIGT